MREIIDYLKEIWNINLAREVILVVISVLATHYFDTRKLKREQQIRFQEGISARIDNALESARVIATEAKVFEVYDDSLAHAKPKDSNAFKDLVIYPAFMNDVVSLEEFCLRLSAVRMEQEVFLDLISAGYLNAMEKYLMNFALYLNKNNFQDGCNTLGLLLIVDVRKWAKSFDKHLTRRMNSPHYKLFTQSGIGWKVIRGFMLWKYTKKTILNDLMKDTAERPIEVVQKEENTNEICV